MNNYNLTPPKSSLSKKLPLFVMLALATMGVLAITLSASVEHANYISHDTLQENIMKDLFTQWKKNEGKQYSSTLEEEHRLAAFTANYDYIVKYNADPSNTAILGLTQFADLTNEEFRALKSITIPKRPNNQSTVPVEIDVSTLPTSVDWRTQGVVSPVMDEGNCGACWAITAAFSLSSLRAINEGNLTTFSSQQILDCSYSYGNEGCNGGMPDQAFSYTEKYGCEPESVYPYLGGVDAKCRYNASEVVWKNTGSVDVPVGNSQALAAAVAQQPVSVGMCASGSPMQLYSGGIITSKACGTNMDHTLLVVGYSSLNNVDYWICQNQWATSWGLEGYVYIAKSNSTNNIGTCGIAQLGNYPTV